MKHLFLTLLLAVSLSSIAQPDNRYTSQKVLFNDDVVFDIIQDQDGYIWVGSGAGVARHFNGSQKTIISEFEYGEFIHARQLIDIGNNLWFGDQGTLYNYSKKTEQLRIIPPNDTGLALSDISMAKVNDNEIIVADDTSLYSFSVRSHTLKALVPINSQLPNDIFYLQVLNGKLWIATFDNGFYILDLKSKLLTQLSDNTSLIADSLRDVVWHQEHYWLATDTGLWLLDENFRVANHHDMTNTPDLSNNFIRGFTLVNDRIQLYTDSQLLASSNNAQDIRVIKEWKDYLEHGAVETVTVDKDGNYWVGTFDASEDKEDSLTATRTSNLYKLNRPKSFNQVSTYDSLNYKHLQKDHIFWAIASKTADEDWLMSQNNEIFIFDRSNDQLHPVAIDPVFYQQTNSTKNSTDFWDLVSTDDGKIWIATSSGLHIFQYNDVSNQLEYQQSLFENVTIPNLHQAFDRIWFPQNNTLVYVDVDTLTATIFTLPSSKLDVLTIALIEDGDTVWVNSTELGLITIDLSKNQYVVQFTDVTALKMVKASHQYWLLDQQNQLNVLSNSILSKVQFNDVKHVNEELINIAINNNNLLLSSDHKIIKLQISNQQIVWEHSLNNSGITEFNESAFHIGNGYLLAGGVGGFLAAQLESNDTKERTLPPVITAINVNGVALHESHSAQQDNIDVSYAKSAQLDYNHAFFNIVFNYLNPSANDEVQYRYKLKNHLNQWLTANQYGNKATYSQLAPGTYHFEVQASVNGKNWSSSRTLDIVVEQPPWFSLWAWALYAVVGLSFAVYLIWLSRVKARVRRTIKENEQRLQQTLDASGDELWDWTIASNELVRLNQWQHCAFPQDNLRSKISGKPNIHPSDYKRVRKALKQHLTTNQKYYETYRIKDHSDNWVWVLDQGTCIEFDENNMPTRMTGTLKNIDQIKATEVQLTLFQRSIETLSDGVFITDPQFSIIKVNASFCGLLNNKESNLIGRHLLDKYFDFGISPEQLVSLRFRESLTTEISLKTTNKTTHLNVLIDAIINTQGEITHYVGVLSNITQRKMAEQELRHLANHDVLTGLPNRTSLSNTHNQWLEKDIQHALLTMDMDNFKKINDSFNHDVGDHIIKSFAQRLEKLASKDVLCFRFGGDEFSILMQYSEISKVIQIARNILDTLNKPIKFKQYELIVNCSLGIALSQQHGNTSQDMLRNADTAMYHAKSRGGDQYQFFNDSLNEDAVRKLQIENLIRHGLKEKLFTLHYQPKVNINTGAMVGMEALVRFEHPEKGLISPAKFIPIAEETGQIIELGAQILDMACAQASEWVKQGLFKGRVAINISAHQLNQPKFDQVLTSILDKYDLSPKYIECEITESTLIGDPQYAKKIMQKLKRLGLHLALDDFGTGYSSLAYLTQFPFDTLKIDKTFIDGVVGSQTDRALLSSIIDIANNLGLEVVAEGVEDQDQLSVLHKYKCEIVQGYLFSKPLKPKLIEAILVDKTSYLEKEN